MKKSLLARSFVVAAAGILAVAAAGCSSVVTATKFNGMQPEANNEVAAVGHINSRISGLYLFGCIPLFSGKIGDSSSTTIFTNTATIDNAFFQMNLEARSKGALSVIDITSTTHSSMILPIFLYWNTAEVTGTAVRPAQNPSASSDSLIPFF